MTTTGRILRSRQLWLLISAWVLVTVVGAVGFRMAYGSMPLPSTAYLTLQLFANGFTPADAEAPLNPPLEFARFAAPLLLGGSVLLAIWVILRESAERIRVGMLSGHVIVVGLGHKGSVAIDELAGTGRRIVGIEIDPLSPGIVRARERRVSVLTGDGRDPELLRRVRVDRASRLLALTGSDNVNAEVLLTARHRVPLDRRVPLECLVHIDHPDMATMLLSHHRVDGPRPTREDFFDAVDRGVHAMVAAHPPAGDGPVRVLIVSTPRSAELLVSHLCSQLPTSTRLHCEVNLPDASASQRHLEQLDTSGRCQLTVNDDPLTRDRLVELVAGGAATAYVCLGSDSATVRAALELNARAQGLDLTVVMGLTESPVLSELFDSESDRFWNLHSMSRYDSGCRNAIQHGTYLQMARRIHERYVEAQLAQGVPESDPSLQDWDSLPVDLKESNLSQADSIVGALAHVGLLVLPGTARAGPEIELTPSVVDRLARAEHDRWMHERVRQGWRPGERDAARRTHPDLRPYDELPEDVREKDRTAVMEWPELLDRAGLHIEATGTSAAAGRRAQDG